MFYTSIFNSGQGRYVDGKGKGRSQKKKDYAGLFIPAGFFLGFGLGFVSGNVPAGMFSGSGIGFLLFAIAKLMKK